MSVRTNTNPRYDISPQLQSVLNNNGMQAHISMLQDGTYQLATLSHNSSQVRYYSLTSDQVDKLTNGGTIIWDKNAYNTFVSIVKNDYYIPESLVSARNANSVVNMGLSGHRLNVGEYGYMGEPRFRSFEGPGFGRFGSFFGRLFGYDRHFVRRVNDHAFYASSAPVVLDRPNGRLKPGELKTGSYGFYDKGQQQQGPLQDLSINVKPQVLERPKGLSEPLSDVTSPLYLTAERFKMILASHGVVIDDKNSTLTIKSSSVNKDAQYDLTESELKTLMTDKFKYSDAKGIHNKNGVSIDERLDLINKVISEHFEDKITREQLNTKDYISIKLKPEEEQKLFPKLSLPQQFMSNTDVVEIREMYHTGYIDKWNSIGVVDGRFLSSDKGFYLPIKDGRAVSVGEIQAYPTNDGQKTTFRMTAIINGEVMSHDITKADYVKFLNYDDNHRLALFDKVFKEVSIKSSSNGVLQDAKVSGNIDNALGVVVMKGNYSLVSDSTKSAITSAMAWKDQISGNYLINVRTDKDAGMWSFKITEEQYNAFKDAKDSDRAKMLTTLIPFTDENKQKMEVIKTSALQKGIHTEASNGNTLSDKVLVDLDKEGLGAEALTVKEQKEIFSDKTSDTTQKRSSVTGNNVVSYGKEQINLNDLRTATKINLLGDAGVNGESLNNLKESKEWKRSGDYGRTTTVGDITVEKSRDAAGKIIEGKYKMSAVIDGNVFTHEINQKQYDKFLAVNDYQRMKLFDKIFPEVEMKTKDDHKFNLGAAILAAVTTGVGVMAVVSDLQHTHHSPEVYEEHNVYFKPGVVHPADVAAMAYSSINDQAERGHNEGVGLGI